MVADNYRDRNKYHLHPFLYFHRHFRYIREWVTRYSRFLGLTTSIIIRFCCYTILILCLASQLSIDHLHWLCHSILTTISNSCHLQCQNYTMSMHVMYLLIQSARYVRWWLRLITCGPLLSPLGVYCNAYQFELHVCKQIY